MTSYYNRYLQIDLDAGPCSTFALPQEVLSRYVGGKGVAAYLLALHQDPEAEPFDPANRIIFAITPFGFFGQEIKAAGYDGRAAGHHFTDADLERLRRDCYVTCGWDEQGVPKPETLAMLDVEYPRRS